MFVYGIRCSPADLSVLPPNAQADYYMDYGLLIFPAYTRPSAVDANGNLGSTFWSEVDRMSQNKVFEVTLEHPYISDEEDSVVNALRPCYPGLAPTWYHVPRVA